MANGSADEFQKGEHLFKAKAVKDALQIGKCNAICWVLARATVRQPSVSARLYELLNSAEQCILVKNKVCI